MMDSTVPDMSSETYLSDNIAVKDLKIPPHSLEAEQSVLGGLMIANDNWDIISDMVSENDFYKPSHRYIFAQTKQLIESHQPVDVITLAEALSANNLLEKVGGFSYLTELAQHIPSVTNIKAYAHIVRERANLRAMIAMANWVVDSAYDTGGRTSDHLLEEAEKRIVQISQHRSHVDHIHAINPLLTQTLDRIDELYKTKDGLTGLSTGFKDLDDKTLGLQSADLIVVAARPSMGKTAFVMNVVENVVMSNDKPVVVFSMEMPAEALIMRMISSLGRIQQNKVRSGKLDKEDWPKLNATANQLVDRPLFIDDTPALTPTEIRSRVRRIMREHGVVSMIVVDYLQLMQSSRSNENRTTEISEISRSLKAIAKEFNCPLVAVSQLNRSLEQRPNKRPISSDLRESGAIEQDADVIICLYRDEVYHEESQDKGIAEVIIRKQRNGPIGTVRLAFNGQYTRFDNLSTRYTMP